MNKRLYSINSILCESYSSFQEKAYREDLLKK